MPKRLPAVRCAHRRFVRHQPVVKLAQDSLAAPDTGVARPVDRFVTEPEGGQTKRRKLSKSRITTCFQLPQIQIPQRLRQKSEAECRVLVAAMPGATLRIGDSTHKLSLRHRIARPPEENKLSYKRVLELFGIAEKLSTKAGVIRLDLPTELELPGFHFDIVDKHQDG